MRKKLGNPTDPIGRQTYLENPRISFDPDINLFKPSGHVMRHQFNIQQLYALPTMYLCVLYLSENKQRLVPLTP